MRQLRKQNSLTSSSSPNQSELAATLKTKLQNMSEKPGKTEEPFGLGCALEFFTEHEEVFQMIKDLPKIVDLDTSTLEHAYERFLFILSQYIEQPHLLDKHIDEMLQKMIDIIRCKDNSMKLKHLTFKYMFVIVNVRGYKVIISHLPHEVGDFEPVLKMLEEQDPNDHDTWTTRYILLLWLSIIVIIPFHMSRFDGYIENNSGRKSVMERVMDLIKIYAVVPDKCRDAAAYLSYRFVTRSDVKEIHLNNFLEWACSKSLSDNQIFVSHGALACVATILKHGKREDLLIHARKLLQWIVNSDIKKIKGSNVHKLVYKIIQRIGLTFLSPRVAAWRYKRGNRSLAANLSAGDSGNSVEQEPNASEETSSEEIEVPDEIEEVIDQLIQGLGDIDGIVRWSAAKGIGRVTNRLSKELADDVVASVLELFNPREGDSAWHGGCLALAELGRRGLLLPERLPQVVPIVLKALVYDEPKGFASVGSHIRDAACYVCWSFARAYDTEVLRPFVPEIAGTLLIVTCFDKEINCRRAASAAFQENVGRQGTFPHGIEILTAADFFAVSMRSNAYLNVSVYIAQFNEYTVPLINHLLERKVDHWDLSIRELTAKALHNLTDRDPSYMIKVALPALLEKTVSIDLNSRHGSVLALGEVLLALSKHSEFSMPKNILDQVKDLIGIYRQRLYFRGLGGELMKQACCDFIEKCSRASLPFHQDPVKDDWLSLVNECLKYNVVNIRNNAINALPVLLDEYYKDDAKSYNSLVKSYIEQLSNNSDEVSRMGHSLALGSLPTFILKPNIKEIIDALIQSTVITHHTLKWAEGRRDSIKALTSILVTMENCLEDIDAEYVVIITKAFLEGLNDYTQDKRGDIGAWVREASMTGLETLTSLLAKHRATLLDQELVAKIISGIVQQAVEKIDRTRAVAGKAFYSCLYHEPLIPNIPHFEDLISIFPKDECDMLNWNSSATTFIKFVKLLEFPVYSYSVMLGMIYSVGGLTESLVKNSSTALFTFLKDLEQRKGPKEIEKICDVIIKIFMDFQKNDRIIVPMFRFLDKLIDSGTIDCIIQNEQSDFGKKILKLVQSELLNCKDIYKLIDGIGMLCQFVQIKGDVCDSALVQLSILLCHRQPYIRKSTSNKLYESLLVNGDSSNIDPDNLEEAMQILSGTNWEDPIETVRPIRNELCKAMGIRIPVPKKKL